MHALAQGTTDRRAGRTARTESVERVKGGPECLVDGALVQFALPVARRDGYFGLAVRHNVPDVRQRGSLS